MKTSRSDVRRMMSEAVKQDASNCRFGYIGMMAIRFGRLVVRGGRIV